MLNITNIQWLGLHNRSQVVRPRLRHPIWFLGRWILKGLDIRRTLWKQRKESLNLDTVHKWSGICSTLVLSGLPLRTSCFLLPPSGWADTLHLIYRLLHIFLVRLKVPSIFQSTLLASFFFFTSLVLAASTLDAASFIRPTLSSPSSFDLYELLYPLLHSLSLSSSLLCSHFAFLLPPPAQD